MKIKPKDRNSSADDLPEADVCMPAFIAGIPAGSRNNKPEIYRAFFMSFFVYILYSQKSDRYYIGQSKDTTERLQRHNAGKEIATAPYISWEIRCVISKPTRGEAMVLERKLKNLNRKRLEEFIRKYGNTGL